MTPQESEAWRPQIQGWSADILPWYRSQAERIPDGALCVEVGVFHGRSLLFLAAEFIRLGKRGVKLYGVDPAVELADWGGPEDRHDDWGHLIQNVAAAPLEERLLIHLVRAPSVQAARMFRNGTVFLTFIDGAHDDDNVSADIRAWLPKMCRGGLIGGHDYGAAPGVAQAVDRYFIHTLVEGSVWYWPEESTR